MSKANERIKRIADQLQVARGGLIDLQYSTSRLNMDVIDTGFDVFLSTELHRIELALQSAREGMQTIGGKLSMLNSLINPKEEEKP